MHSDSVIWCSHPEGNGQRDPKATTFFRQISCVATSTAKQVKIMAAPARLIAPKLLRITMSLYCIADRQRHRSYAKRLRYSQVR